MKTYTNTFATLVFCGLALMSASLSTGAASQDQRQERQQERIVQRVQDREFATWEARVQRRNEHHIARTEARLKVNAAVTARERARIQQKQKMPSECQYRQKNRNAVCN